MSHIRDRRAIRFAVLAAAAAGTVMLSAQTPDPKALGYPASGQPGVVTLLSPGAEPRMPLRCTAARDYKAHMEMTIETTISMAMQGQPMPALQMPEMKMGADVAVTDVSSTGDITYNVAFTGVSVGAGGDPMMAQMLQGIDADFKTVKGTATVSNRGLNKAVKFDYSKVSNPQFGQMMGAASSSLENMSLALPEEAVGVGARWEVRQSVTAFGIQSYMKNEYEVVSIDGNTVTLRLKQETMALPQAVTNPAMPPGTETMLTKMTGTGSGTIALPLAGLVPTSTLISSTSMAMDITAMGQQMAMTTDSNVKISIAPAPPPR